MENLQQLSRMLAYERQQAKSSLDTVNAELGQLDKQQKSIVIKKIRGHLYYYEQWNEGGKLHSRSLGAVAPGSIAETERQMLKRDSLLSQKKNLEKLLQQLDKMENGICAEIMKQPILNEYSFEVYWKNEITARVYVHRSEAIISRFVEHPVKQLFAKNRMTRDQINRVLELRCWDRGRPDLPELLQSIGLTEFNPQEIVRRTHGVTWNDFIWFRFPGENITCKDVLLRQDFAS